MNKKAGILYILTLILSIILSSCLSDNQQSSVLLTKARMVMNPTQVYLIFGKACNFSVDFSLSQLTKYEQFKIGDESCIELLIMSKYDKAKQLLHFANLLAYYNDRNGVECLKSNEGIRKMTFKGLMNVYDKLGTKDSVAKHTRLLCSVNNLLVKKHFLEEITRMKEIHHYDKVRLEAQEKSLENRNWWIVCLSGIIILLILYVIYIKRKEFSKHTQEDSCKSSITKTVVTVSTLGHSLSCVSGEVSEMGDFGILEYKLTKSDIAKRFQYLSKHGMKMSENDKHNLKDFMEDMTPCFMSAISNTLQQLTLQELLTCILSVLQFQPKEVSILLDCSAQRTTNIRSNVNRKLFGERGSSLLDQHLIYLLKQSECQKFKET